MLLEELIIEKIRRYPHLFDLSSESYKNIDLKNNDWQNIANEINDQCIQNNTDGSHTKPNIQGKFSYQVIFFAIIQNHMLHCSLASY